MVLYEILNIIDSKRYVGITCDIKRRWREHRAELKSGKHHNKHLQAAWNLYGKDSFEFNTISKFNNLEELNKAEIEFINKNDLKNPSKGYNLADGGNSFEHTPEAKSKIIEAQLKPVVRKNLNTGVEVIYSSLNEVIKDGFNPKCLASVCNLTVYEKHNRKFTSKTHKGNVWMYLEDYNKNPNELIRRFNEFKNTKARSIIYRAVIGRNIKTNEIVRFESIYHSKKLGFSPTTIMKICKNNKINISHKGFVWAYLENIEELDFKVQQAKNKKTHKV